MRLKSKAHTSRTSATQPMPNVSSASSQPAIKRQPVFLPPVKLLRFPVVTAAPISPTPIFPGTVSAIPVGPASEAFQLDPLGGNAGNVVLCFPQPNPVPPFQLDLDPSTGFPLGPLAGQGNTQISFPNPLPRVRAFSVTHDVGGGTHLALSYYDANTTVIRDLPFAEAAFMIELLRTQGETYFDPLNRRLITR
jgi:hypothetical protein